MQYFNLLREWIMDLVSGIYFDGRNEYKFKWNNLEIKCITEDNFIYIGTFSKNYKHFATFISLRNNGIAIHLPTGFKFRLPTYFQKIDKDYDAKIYLYDFFEMKDTQDFYLVVESLLSAILQLFKYAKEN